MNHLLIKNAASIILCTCLALSTANRVSAAQPDTLPNIVYILADDMGVGDVHALYADAKVATPHLDSLVANGMHFTDAHTPSSVCTPTRYSILTGRYSWRSELKKQVVAGYSRALITPERDTVAALLQRNGYQTTMIGKWHLGLDWKLKDGTTVTELKEPKGIEAQIDFTQPFRNGPIDLGFDSWYGINASLDFPPYTWLQDDQVVEVPTIARAFQGGKKVGEPHLMMRSGLQTKNFDPALTLKGLTERTIKYIQNVDTTAPFFIYMPLNSPHTPVTPRKEFLGKSQAGIYGDFVEETDWSVGQVVAALEQKGVLNNTLIIFTADNGASRASFPTEWEAEFGHHPSATYKGRKGSLDEGGHRVPFIAQWPAVISANNQNNTPCNLIDFYATCADLLNVKVAPNTGEDSISMLPLFTDDNAAYQRTEMVHHDFGGRFAFRQGKWKLITSQFAKKQALYDMELDPSETTNLIEQHPEVVERMLQRLTTIVQDGRSTPGPRQSNEGPAWWPELSWIEQP